MMRKKGGAVLKRFAPRRLARLLALMMALTPLATDAYLPAIPDIAHYLGTEASAAANSMSLYLLGFACGQVIFGPISDRIGRRPVAIGGIIVFFLSSLALAFSSSLMMFCSLRFVEALGGGACSVNAAAVVRDRFSGRESARMMSTMTMILLLAPLGAPSLGALLNNYAGGWQAIFLFLAIYALIALTLVSRKLPETAVLSGHAEGLATIARRYGRVLGHRAALGYIIAVACSYAGIFSFLSASSYLCINYYKVPEWIYGLMFTGNIILVLGANRLNLSLLKHHSPHDILKVGMMLQLCFGVMALLTVALRLDAAWTLMPLVIIFSSMNGLITANAISSMLDYFPSMSATATAALGCIQFSSGGIGSFIVNAFGDYGPWPLVIMLTSVGVISNVMFRLLSEAHARNTSREGLAEKPHAELEDSSLRT